MPPPTSLEPGTPAPESETRLHEPSAAPDSKAPLSFVPHDPSGALPREPVRIRTNRFGDLEEHELVHLLDTIQDERAKARFRESIYISLFVWMAIAWVVLYGPRYLWHAPVLLNPADVLKQRELTQLTLPTVPHVAAPAPRIDNKTLEHLRETARSTPKTPAAPQPTPPPTAATPMPTTTPVIPPPTAPTPNVRTPPPAVAEAPTPQPTTRPNFSTNNGTAADAIRDALNNAAKSRGGGDYHDRSNGPLKMGGMEILSDTQGVDFNPYLQRILADIKRNWLPLIPEEAQPPLRKQGETFIRFTILPDGNIGGMHLDGSTHDDAINHSAWSSITSEGQFPALPSQFHGPNLELRIHFFVNKEPE